MVNVPQTKKVHQSRPLHFTIELAKKADITAEEARKVLLDVLSNVSEKDLESLNLRSGQLTVIL